MFLQRRLVGHRTVVHTMFKEMASTTELHVPKYPVRFVTAASLFDGHDAAINIMRRLLQAQGAEVIHLGHNRSVEAVARAAIEEDAQGIAVSSYQGGHVEYFKYLVDELHSKGRPEIRVYGGGGGVIITSEIEELQAYGVRRIFSPTDGQQLGLDHMINVLIKECDLDVANTLKDELLEELIAGETNALARTISAIDGGSLPQQQLDELMRIARTRAVPVLGITGTGGSGKSSLTDELVRRFRLDLADKLRIAVLAVDPTKRRGGGALLGDRIRMNANDTHQVYFRSLATRDSKGVLPTELLGIISACKAAGYDLVIVETPGIGQGDSAIADIADVCLYVMTPEYGAASQLEKIEMLDLADFVAINKFERFGAEDALRAVQRQWIRSRGLSATPESIPIFGTIASHFNDNAVTALYQALREALRAHGLPSLDTHLAAEKGRTSSGSSVIVPAVRRRYLAEIVESIERYRAETENQSLAARRYEQLRSVQSALEELGAESEALSALAPAWLAALHPSTVLLLEDWKRTRSAYRAEELEIGSGTETTRASLTRTSLAGIAVRRVSLPRFEEAGELVRWLRTEHLPGHFPFTAGVFPLKREGEDPARMFAGEGDPFRTNRRFHLLAEGQRATRLSVAFDSVTLYGADPAERPDIYGKIGTSGVSIATLDDMKALFQGFDLCDPATSVSMTINGPAPAILAMFLNTAIDQQLEMFQEIEGRAPDSSEEQRIRQFVLTKIRGTVQADILKEDQGQNTCIFSTEFSLGVMADIQQFFVEHSMKNFYSVSISGYHIAEAGANPVTQLAFTLANAFTYVEAYIARGMTIDEIAPNLSFFFSNGMDPEYTVLGRVARRIWAIAMRDRYHASERSQRLKYHVQTSGRSLHAQEMAFNDIRTTLQALCAIYDNANSLHSNAYDEAVTTPTQESVRRALAIQMIINNEWGLAMNENPLQGSFVIEELTDLLEDAVLAELQRLSDRGGVLGAMETGYQRGRIQDDSMLYEQRKHDGTLPIVGVNMFLSPHKEDLQAVPDLVRATEEEKQGQLTRLRAFQNRHELDTPQAIANLQSVSLRGGNVFAELIETVRHASLGQITDALFAVGGSYRRNV